jgi:hypothetical protein
MSSKLPLTIPIGCNETPTSYASRLAAINCVSARLLGQDFLFSFQSIVNGEHNEIRRVAELGGVAATPLIEHAVVKTEDGFLLRGQQLTKATIRRARVVACPFCLTEDVHNTGLPASLAVHGRSEWQVASIRTCRLHNSSLVTFAEFLQPGTLHDFSRNVAPLVSDISKMKKEAVPRKPSGLETYMLDRLDGHAPHPFLDNLPFYAAAWTTEIVGAVMEFGKKVKLDALTDDQRQRAGQVGFEFMRDGATGLEHCMSELKRDHSYNKGRASSDGPQAVYGKLYMTFAQGLQGPHYDPVREVMREHILSNFALGPDDEVFGKPVGTRRLHSIRTAAKTYNMHQKRLRKLVLAECGEQHSGKADRDILFGPDMAERIYLRESSLMTLKSTETYLNAPRPLASLMSDAGVIRRHAVGDGTADRYLKSELDQLLAALYAKAVPVSETRPGMFSVPEAARRANCTVVEIIRLIRDGILEKVEHIAGRKSGVLDLIVSSAEVRERTRLPELAGVLPLEAAKLLRTNQDVVKKLIKLGAINTITQHHPAKRNLTTVVPLAEIERFKHQHISLFALARERCIGLPKLKRWLQSQGVKPAFDGDVGATFYRRSELK